MTVTPMQAMATAVFAIALVHTFSTGVFERLAGRHPAHAGMFHLLGEVEVVFGFWAMVLVTLLFVTVGTETTLHYVESRDFTEPLFVFAIMIVAGSRPILALAGSLVSGFARLLPFATNVATLFSVLFLVPLLGSLITEPAAMTLGALMLRDQFFREDSLGRSFRYAAVGVLFVNVSIGGVLTHFAAPPVLMVAGKWGWDAAFMLKTFGWKAVIAVAINAAGITWGYRKALASLAGARGTRRDIPVAMMLSNVAILLGIVAAAHHPVLFMGLLLFFMGFATAYRQHQGHLIVREALLVAFFLAGLVVLGGQQQWWLQPLLLSMEPQVAFFGAIALTAFTDNAALTYLASLVDGLTSEFQYMLVAGAVTGGGLTVIANAPNPAGYSILKSRFENETISALGLLAAAAPPTVVAMAAFLLL